MNRMGLLLQHFLRYSDGDDMLNRTVTGEESKRASMQWKHPSSPSTKKFKITSTPSDGKVMLTLRVLEFSAHFQKRGENVNSAS
jgi:hypothetical protein